MGRKSRGFSLIESMVIVSIMGIMTTISLRALPAVRAHQQLVSDTEQVRALLLDSKQRAINQVRPEKCLSEFAPNAPERQACSDVGVSFQGKTIIQFADLNGNRNFDASDFTIVRLTFSSPGLQPGSDSVFVFTSAPPTVHLFRNGQRTPMSPDSVATILLKTPSGEARKLEIRQFGIVNIITR